MTLFSPTLPDGLRICPQHLQMNALKTLLGNQGWNWAFTIVRNPYERMESEYAWRTDMQFKNSDFRPDFSSWLIENLGASKKNPFHLDNHFRRQVEFIDIDVKVYKLETELMQAAQAVAKHLEIESPTTLGVDNVSGRPAVEWSTEALEMVNEYYENDFITFGYGKRKLPI